ncbi:DivIVA domain-containing protein [Williamsoniiplasma luminosum]|uniref:DivIVA domain-containing protein n=1 Tax=Williamsoniiplasma luminosum TaxID=214888 RepID=A0A2K8NUF7_9MOLU|nr:DivIVA domain-containing protein [Williamsoniiplasma luminosum]ATZ17439.1 DivIVA domain-containing protein [Williamsoniiplasma luminosum]
MQKIKNFTIEELQTHEFSIELQGYKIEEVNVFIDDVQQDYIAFKSEIEHLTNELTQTQNNLKNLKNENVNLKERSEVFLASHNKQIKENLSNADIFTRLSSLEDSMKRLLSYFEDNSK